jgi:hypothetical protein
VVGLALRPARPEPICLLTAPGFDRSAGSSAACLSCHDGTAALSVSTHAHPLERSFADAWLAHRADLRGIPARELVLVNGLVTCLACHDGASPHPRHLALPLAELCQGCHGL